MSIWEKPLTHETFDEFFRLFAPPAYRSTYRILGDTTRTESALMESFLEVYHQRNSDDVDDLVFLFSDILQKRVQLLASRYPLPDNMRVTNRVLDEFTENSILDEIHRRIDSTSYRILEMFSSSAGKNNMNADPILGQIQKSGISIYLLLQLAVVAVIIFAVTFTCAKTVFGINKLAPTSPDKVELSIEDVLVPALNYLPLSVSGQNAESQSTQATKDSASVTGSISKTTTAVTGSSNSTGTAASSKSQTPSTTVASATRG
jgi:hypothetical protein